MLRLLTADLVQLSFGRGLLQTCDECFADDAVVERRIAFNDQVAEGRHFVTWGLPSTEKQPVAVVPAVVRAAYPHFCLALVPVLLFRRVG